jgi:hypothetical protein
MVVCWVFVEMQIGVRRQEPGTWKECLMQREGADTTASVECRNSRGRTGDTRGVAMFYLPSSFVACNNRAELHLLKLGWAGCMSGMPLALQSGALCYSALHRRTL